MFESDVWQGRRRRNQRRRRNLMDTSAGTACRECGGAQTDIALIWHQAGNREQHEAPTGGCGEEVCD